MTTSNIPSPSGSTQTTATSHNLCSSFSNQLSSRYPAPSLIPYSLFPPYFLPVQQPVLPQSYPKAYPYMLQHWNDPTCAHAPSNFPDSIRQPSSSPYQTEQSSHQQYFPPHPLRQSYNSNHDSTISAYHSLAPPSPSATTPSGVTASPSTPAHQRPLSPAMQRYVTYLKNVYSSIDTPVYDKEHSLLQVKAKSFINIALVHKDSPQYMNNNDWNEMLMDRLHGHVDAIQRKKTKLFICDVCKSLDGRLARSVLVEGAPGVGKTTFANELCKQWAREEILMEWAAVVLIKLRDHTTRTAQSMYDLLYHPRPEIQQAVVDELIDHDGKGMLLILDGYDELTDSQKESTSVIQRIMSKKLLVQATLMVTSRPLATRTLHDNFMQSNDQHIEVLGFTEKNIEEYILSACGDKPELVEDFKSYLSCHPFSSALMFNPLQCAIVTDLYRSHWERGDKGFAPKTLTELYTGVVHIMLLRYLTQHPVYKDEYSVWWISDLSDLPEEVSQQLKAVTELAAKGIKKRQYVFDEFDRSIPSETLGLMQKEQAVASGSGISTSHNFLHLTLQEYLAAVNYSQQYSSPVQLSQLLTRFDLFPLSNFLQYYGMEREPTIYSSATHWPVVLFVAGRTKLSGVSTNIFKTGLHHDNDDNDITTVNVSLLHLLYETQSPQLIQSTLVTSRKYLFVSGSSALDWFVIGYCIANSTSTWRVVIDSNDSPKYFDQLVIGLHLGPEECSGECKIGSLHISGHWNGNLKILSNLHPYAKSVTEIKLVGNKQKDILSQFERYAKNVSEINVVCNELMEQCDSEQCNTKSISVEESACCYPMLKELIIENIEIITSASVLSFISQHSNLHILSLNQCNLSCIATSSLTHFIQSPNNRLHEVTLDDCTIRIPCTSKSVAISYKIELISDTGNFSFRINGSLNAINYMLSQTHQFYASALTILKVTIVSGTIGSLQTSLFPHLVILEIVSEENVAHLHVHSFLFSSYENSLRILSLMNCYLCNECVRSLIHLLRSPNNKLYKLTLDDCTIQIPDHTNSVAISYQMQSILPSDNRNFSLEITSSLYAINYLLSQPHQFYTNTLTVLKVTIVSGTTDSLQMSSFPHLVTLEIVSKSEENAVYLHSFLFGSHENNLHILSLMRCQLSNECVRSLIHLLQSPNNRLHKLVLDDCTIEIPDHTNSVAISYQMESISPTVNRNFSLEIISSLYAINYILSQPHLFYTNTLTILKVTIVSRTTNSLQISLFPHLVTLEIVSKSEENAAYLHNFPFSSHENNLHILSLTRCQLSNECVRSLMHFLQSPNNRLHKLTLDDCTIQIPDHTNSVAISYQMESISPSNFSLTITASLYAINCMLSRPHLFYSNASTILQLQVVIVSEATDSFIEKSSFQNLSMLDTTSEEENHTLLYDSVFHVISQQNNLRILSLKRYKLTCDMLRLFTLSLQSSHCGLQELTLEDCIFDHTHTTRASSKLKLKSLDSGNVSLEFTGYCCDISHWVLQLSSYTQLTQLILYLRGQDCTTAVTLQKILLHHHVLKSLKISSNDFTHLPLFIPHLIGLQQNNLHNLSLRRCTLNSGVTRSLIHSLQSPHCRLHKVTMYKCAISTPDKIQQKMMSTKNNTTLYSLVITDSLFVLNHILSNIFFKQMKELTLCITTYNSSGAEVLAKIPVSCPVLETMKIDSYVNINLPLSISQFIGLRQNNLHNLSLSMCDLSSDVTRSLIHSLHSQYCRLYKLTMCKCKISTIEKAQQNLISTKNNTTLHSLVTNNSLCVLNHILSNVFFTQMTELSLCITSHDSSEAEVLTKIPGSCPVLETIKINSSVSLSLPHSIPQLIGSQQNNLHTLSLSGCNLSSDVTRSLIHSLKSPHCRLHKIVMNKCAIISTAMKTQQNTISAKNNTTLCSLVTTDSLCVLKHILSNVFFTQMTELSLRITKSGFSAAGVLTRIPISCPVLETIKIDSDVVIYHTFFISQFIGLQLNNLHTLSLRRCDLRSVVTRSLIHSMQSPCCRLQNLALKNCTVSLPEDTEQTTILTKMNTALHSLDISWSVLNQMMSCINPFTQSLTELILHVDNDTQTFTSCVETLLQEIPSNCPLLETLKIDSILNFFLPLSIPQFIGSQQNNLHTLSLKGCNLNSDVTWSLIYSLQSSDCKLYKLALYCCTIPTADHTQLTTATVSSTTITHLLFIDRPIDTPSLTALASGLKHNTTIEQLTADKYYWDFTEDQFRVLIDAVDSSAVKNLWLYDCSKYKKWFSDCTLSRNNVNIEWYTGYSDLYNKW